MAHLNFFYVAQFTYALTLLSFAFREINWLRLTAVIQSVVVIGYSAVVAEEPLWIPILWNLLFIAVNVGQLLLTRWRQRAVALDPVETFLSKTILANFPPAEVKNFTQISRDGTLSAGQRLIKAGQELHHLFCLTKGKVDIIVHGKKTAELTAGYFVGEMSFLTQSVARADVIAATDINLLVWPHEEIQTWVGSDASRLALLQTALGTQVVDQLLRQNEELLRATTESEAV